MLRQHRHAHRGSVGRQRAGAVRPQPPGPGPGRPERSEAPRRLRPARGPACQRRPLFPQRLPPCCPLRQRRQRGHRPERRQHPPFPAAAGPLPAALRPSELLLFLPPAGLPASPRHPLPPPARTGSPVPWARGPGRRLRPPRERRRFPAQGCPRAQAPPAAHHRPPMLRQHPHAQRRTVRHQRAGAVRPQDGRSARQGRQGRQGHHSACRPSG